MPRARAGSGAETEADRLVDELCERSAEFVPLCRDKPVHAHGEGNKRLRHASLGTIELEYSAFSVNGRPDLGLIVYHPASDTDAERIRQLIDADR